MLNKFFILLFKSLGWGFDGSFEPQPSKFIIIVGPHTSNWDFPLGILVRKITAIGETKFLGKSQLFKYPYGFIFRWLGGYPVERTKNNNLVDSVVDIFNSKEKFSIAIAPEGSRSKVKRFKTGFYHIAKNANIPIIMVGFDFAQKKIVVKKPLYPTADIKADFKLIFDFFTSIKGKNPIKGVDMGMYKQFLKGIETEKNEVK